MEHQRVSRDVFDRAVQRAQPLGWHVKVQVEGADLLELEGWLRGVRAPLVIDHVVHMHPEHGIDQPAMRVLLDLHRRENIWALSCNCDHWPVDGPPHYTDCLELARAVLRNAPSA